MNIFFRLLRFSRPYHHYVPEYAIYIFLYIIFGLASYPLLAPVFDLLFNTVPQAVKEVPHPSFSLGYVKDFFSFTMGKYMATPGGRFKVLIYVCGLIFLSIILKNLFGYLSQRTMTRMRVTIVRKLRNQVYNRFSTQSLQFYHDQRKGDLISIMSNDVVEIENSLVQSVQVIMRDPLQIIGTFALLFYMSAKLTIFCLVFFPISGILISTLSKNLKKRSIHSQGLLGKILNITEESLSGIRIIKGFNAEKFMDKKFAEENNSFAQTTKIILNQRELASPISEILGVLVIMIIMIFGGYLIIGGHSTLTAAGFIAYISLYFQIIQPAKNIASAISYLQRGLAAGERVLKIIDYPNPIQNKAEAPSIKGFDKEIVYNNVSFQYETTKVLDEITLHIPKGRIIALVGSSGAGKSTMADLLPRFYDVTSGHITIDGKDIRDVTMESVRDLIGIVSQEAILFNDTVFNNIAFGNENADMEAVIKAAKIANAHEFISQMEKGYQSSIGDKGMKLSGGQRQRLTIARAVFKNPDILILDEATSALDTESERLVQDAINNLMKDRTSIVIAHRLSTIRHADEIIVLSKGKIVERGNHQQLIALQGTYKHLVDMQELK
jgi:ATP-binding cassette, subfamily B, bacterial MsbA